MIDSSNWLQKNRTYYQEFGKLFREVTGDSGLLNFGYNPKDKYILDPAEAQNNLVCLVATVGEFAGNQRILDVGCGLGGGSQLVSEHTNSKVIGIDPEFDHLINHKWLNENKNIQPSFFCADSLYLPFSAGTFDRIYSIESAFHYLDKTQFLRESKRLLREKGKLVVADILMSSKVSFSILTKLAKRAVSAASFFSKEDYRSSAVDADLMLTSCIDISAEVSRTFPLWRRAYLAKWKSLRKSYSFLTLIIILFALQIAPSIARLIGCKYMILVFEPQGN